MAETVHLFLKANGNDIKGEPTQISLGRADSIECLEFQTSVKTARETGSGLATGRRQHEPIRILKRIDKSSPLLYKALARNEVVDGKFMFYRPNPTGDGTTEQFYTIEIKQGRISSIKQEVENCIEPASSNLPPLESVEFVFHTITWTYMNGGITHTDDWKENA